MRTSVGFTLLEVLVALAVLAIAMGAIISAATQSVNTVATLRDQTFASWVALNQVNQQLLDVKPWPGEGSRTGSADLANRVWRWEARFSETEDPDLRRLDLIVRASENGLELSRLTAFKGKLPEKVHSDSTTAADQASQSKEKEQSPAPKKPSP